MSLVDVPAELRAELLRQGRSDVVEWIDGFASALQEMEEEPANDFDVLGGVETGVPKIISTGDVSIAQVAAFDPVSGRTFVVAATSKRDPSDPSVPEVGAYLALGRAYEALGRRYLRQGYGRSKHALDMRNNQRQVRAARAKLSPKERNMLLNRQRQAEAKARARVKAARRKSLQGAASAS